MPCSTDLSALAAVAATQIKNPNRWKLGSPYGHVKRTTSQIHYSLLKSPTLMHPTKVFKFIFQSPKQKLPQLNQTLALSSAKLEFIRSQDLRIKRYINCFSLNYQILKPMQLHIQFQNISQFRPTSINSIIILSSSNQSKPISRIHNNPQWNHWTCITKRKREAKKERVHTPLAMMTPVTTGTRVR